MKHLILFIFLMMSSVLSASCLFTYSNINPLKMTLEKIEGKREVYGVMIKSKTDWDNFIKNIDENIDIVYMLNEDLDLIVGPRFQLDTEDDQVLIAHISLYRKLEKMKRSTQIYSSGELIRRNSSIIYLNNRSGTFRGGSDHLDIARKKLVGLQLIDDRVVLHDYSNKSVAGNHVEDVERARNFKSIMQSEPQRKILSEIQSTYFQFVKAFPDDVNSSVASIDKMANSLMNLNSSDNNFMDIYKGITRVEYLQMDGVYRASGEEELKAVLKDMQNTLEILR